MGTTIIGIDCAARDENVGIALARYEGGEARIDCAKSGGEARATLKKWVEEYRPALLALDAPLGWPGPMAEALGSHAAGQKLGAGSHAMFWRTTDRIVKCQLGHQPLAVGANFIAWTAHAALELLEDLRNKKSGLDIPLAWTPEQIATGTCAIEVYPAATLIAHLDKERFKRGAGYAGYKEHTKEGEQKRRSLLSELAGIRPGRHEVQVVATEHAFDAAICVLAGADFLCEEVFRPGDFKLEKGVIEKEGWIWVRDPVLTGNGTGR